MRCAYICLLLLITSSSNSFGQDRKMFNFHWDYTLSAQFINLTGTTDVGDKGGTIVDNNAIVSAPVYEYVEERFTLLNYLNVHIGTDIALLRAGNTTLGLDLNAGVGRTRGIRFDDVPTVFIDFPEYAYVRHKFGEVEYGIAVGYKYAISRLPISLFLVALDVHFLEKHSLRLYGSPVSQKYYQQYSNGEVKPMISISEIGLSYYYTFSGK